MTKTLKILSAISFIAMAIVLTFVGVWALTDLDFTVGGDITYTAPEPEPASITMGTYGGKPVKWRLVAVDGEHYEGTTIPTSGVGTFILETCLSIYHAYDELNDLNEYATSGIRSYLKNDFVSELNITNDAIYQKITPRSISNLYQEMGWRSGLGGILEDCSLPTGSYDTTDDRLWLMSVAEVYKLVGGGTIADATIPVSTSWSSTVRSNLSYQGHIYWLRTPDEELEDMAYYIDDSTAYACTSDWVGVENAVRPAFNLEF